MFRSILVSLCGLCLLCLQGTASAEQVVFGPKECIYSVEVPEGWNWSETASGIIITSADKDSSLAVTVFDDRKVTVRSLQQFLPSKLGLMDVVKQEKKNEVLMTGTHDGVPLQIRLRATERGILSTIEAGTDKETLRKCAASLRHVRKAAKEEQKGKEEKKEEKKEKK